MRSQQMRSQRFDKGIRHSKAKPMRHTQAMSVECAMRIMNGLFEC
jgi:hypothetical protein